MEGFLIPEQRPAGSVTSTKLHEGGAPHVNRRTVGRCLFTAKIHRYATERDVLLLGVAVLAGRNSAEITVGWHPWHIGGGDNRFTKVQGCCAHPAPLVPVGKPPRRPPHVTSFPVRRWSCARGESEGVSDTLSV